MLFYAYDGHFYLALSTFSLLAIDDSIFLNLRWIPHSEDEGFPCVLLMGFHHQKSGRVKLKLNSHILLGLWIEAEFGHFGTRV